MAAAAAIIGGVRCHHWQRPLPIMSPPAANLKKACPFSLCGASPSLFVMRRLSGIDPISLAINNAQRHVITFLANCLMIPYMIIRLLLYVTLKGASLNRGASTLKGYG
ncbi:MAG: hypothetical protein IJ892_14475 [Prevotella sp.]|nr:hypothetical protein [Prevotella sp.]